MTVREIINKIQTPVFGGIPNDSSVLRPRQVYSALISARARVLKDSLKDISDFNYTTLDCVPLERATAYECDCIPQVGCFYHKTACEITGAIGQGRIAIKSVTTLDGREFSYTDWIRVRNRGYAKYSSAVPQYFIRNKRIYLVGASPDLVTATIVVLADDPVVLKDTCSYCETNTVGNCVSYLDEEFPLDQAYILRTIELAKYELFGRTEKATDRRQDTVS